MQTVGSWGVQLAGCGAGRGATEQMTCRDVNGETRDSAHEAKSRGPGCWLGSDTPDGIQDPGKRDSWEDTSRVMDSDPVRGSPHAELETKGVFL